MQGKSSADFRSLMRRTGNTTNVGIFITGFVGFMLVDQIWAWQTALAAAAIVLVLGPVLAFSISKVMHRLKPHLELVLDAPSLESVDPAMLDAARSELLEVPFTNIIVSFVVWLILLPLPIYWMLSAAGLNPGPFLHVYVSIALVFPILAYMSAIAFEFALRPYVKKLFPEGGVERFRSRHILSVRGRILASFTLIGPYFTFVVALLVYRRVRESTSLDMALSRIVPIEFFLFVLSILLMMVMGRYLDRIVNNPLMKLLEPGNTTADSKVAEIAVESADDWGVIADRLNERKRAQDELAVSESRIRSVIESMPVGLLLLDQEGRIELSNSAIHRDTEYDANDLIGQHFSKLLQGAHEMPVSDFWEKSKAEKSEVARTFCQRKNTEQFPVELTVQAFDSREGRRYLAIISDITEREAMEKVKQQFVAVVSHELRSPLTSMLAYLTLLTEGVYGDLNQQGLKRTDATRRNINRLMDLVKDILDIERLQEGQISYLITEVELDSVIKRSIEGMEEFAERQKVTLKVPRTDLIVRADEDRLIQVVINLLSNAIKFDRGGTVEVTVTSDKDYATIGVRDHGRGIPASSQAAIFERFKQVSGADQRSGTGLGLPICKAIVEQHGGSIGVESSEGKGSYFWFSIPLNRPLSDAEP